jgi:uncharacterized membrane protein
VTEDHTEHPPLESHGPLDNRLHSPARLITLSDGVFAIAMTLLALEIQVPEDLADDAEFTHEMAGFFSSLGVFVVAFLIIGQYWLAHHRALSYVHTVDRRALVGSVYPLLGVAAVPAATRLIVGDARHWLAIVAASGILAVSSLMAVRFYAMVLRPEFAEIEPVERRRILLATGFGCVIYLLTIGLVLVLHATGNPPEIAFLAWWLLLLNQRVSRWVAGRREAG